MKLESSTLKRLRKALGEAAIETDPAVCSAYGYDNSKRHNVPAAVLRPDNAEALQAAVEICYDAALSVTARGLGTCTTGSAVPEPDGIVLSTEKLRRIHCIDPDNRIAIADAGVTNGELQREAARFGFFWPPDPTSADYSTIGGNLACNAAGPRAVKYGACRDNTLGIRAVTGDAKLLSTGVRTTKSVVGYDLTRLLIGSEGTLAVITDATLKLTPLPEAVQTMRAVYADVESAAAAVSRIMAQPVTPRVVEFMDDAATDLVRPGTTLPATARALLIIEVDGLTDHLPAAIAAIRGAASGPGLVEFEVASDDTATRALWSARRALSPALRTLAPQKINEDVVVPVSRLAELVTAVRQMGAEHAITTVCFGHAGNGNLHVNLLGQPEQYEAMRACLGQLMRKVIAMDGTISGEHGIGLDKREFLMLQTGCNEIDLMLAIKRQFDPKGILNPGKIFLTT